MFVFLSYCPFKDLGWVSPHLPCQSTDITLGCLFNPLILHLFAFLLQIQSSSIVFHSAKKVIGTESPARAFARCKVFKKINNAAVRSEMLQTARTTQTAQTLQFPTSASLLKKMSWLAKSPHMIESMFLLLKIEHNKSFLQQNFFKLSLQKITFYSLLIHIPSPS